MTENAPAISGVIEEDDEGELATLRGRALGACAECSSSRAAWRVASAASGELEVVPVLGPLLAERLPDFHRLDLRASREWQKRRGVLGFFVEIQNVYNRENIAGYDPDFEFGIGEDGQPAAIYVPQIWGEILPSFGVTWQF